MQILVFCGNTASYMPFGKIFIKYPSYRFEKLLIDLL